MERKGQRHFEVRATDKLRTDSTIECKDPARSAEVKKTPLEGSEFEKLRRRNAF
jgi:hypothetical protein